MAKVVQTKLNEEEYKTLRAILSKKGLSLKEGLHIAVTRFLLEETKIDANDPFLSRTPAGKSGRHDLSNAHDKYLYAEVKR